MTANLPFIKRQTFIHIFGEGRRVILRVDRTVELIRFQWEWSPRFRPLKELEEIWQEWGRWVDYQTKGNPKTLYDLMFEMSCDEEISNLIDTLPP